MGSDWYKDTYLRHRLHVALAMSAMNSFVQGGRVRRLGIGQPTRLQEAPS